MQYANFVVALALAIVANGPGATVNGQEVRPYSNIFVRLNSTVNPIIRRVGSRSFPNRGARIRAIRDACRVSTGSWQAPILDALRPYGVDVRPYWVSNTIYVRNATPEVIQRLREFPAVREIIEEAVLPMRPFINPSPGAVPNGTEWGVRRIGAESVWPNTRGEGVVVGVIDTGVRGTHEALRDNFRVAKGWFDPYFGLPAPTDRNGHGTHCTGTICGNNGIGVAPGAQWMACRGCDTNGCAGSALLACGQFMLCPTDPDGSNEDCNMAPDIVSNSWGGGQGAAWYDDIINAWNAAGIIPFFAIMNNGPRCSTALSPGDRPDVISVGATNVNDTVTSFSGRGPAPDGRIVPSFVAPGQDINSAYHLNDTYYQILSGTSMSTPHAAGAAALLLSENPTLTRQELETLVAETCNQDLPPTGASCGMNGEDTYPNDVAGYGRLDVGAAYIQMTSGIFRP